MPPSSPGGLPIKTPPLYLRTMRVLGPDWDPLKPFNMGRGGLLPPTRAFGEAIRLQWEVSHDNLEFWTPKPPPAKVLMPKPHPQGLDDPQPQAKAFPGSEPLAPTQVRPPAVPGSEHLAPAPPIPQDMVKANAQAKAEAQVPQQKAKAVPHDQLERNYTQWLGPVPWAVWDIDDRDLIKVHDHTLQDQINLAKDRLLTHPGAPEYLDFLLKVRERIRYLKHLYENWQTAQALVETENARTWSVTS